MGYTITLKVERKVSRHKGKEYVYYYVVFPKNFVKAFGFIPKEIRFSLDGVMVVSRVRCRNDRCTAFINKDIYISMGEPSRIKVEVV